MKKVFILLVASFLGGGSFGEVLSNGPANGNAYTCQVYDCTCISVPIEMVFVQGGSLPAARSSNGLAIALMYL
jgi:hypothetical protein